MSVFRFLKGRLADVRASLARRALLRAPEPDGVKRTVDHWENSLSDPTGYYEACFQFFHTQLADELRAHRSYFTKCRRGFGEDAFHVMWWQIFEREKPRDFLEIGVYRGQTLALAALLQRRMGIEGRLAGISPFEAVGDSVSRYRSGLDYLADTQANFEHFSLPQPHLLKAYSTDPEAMHFIRSRIWDCIYIDGNHDYEVAKADWGVCSASVRPGGLIVLDDAALGTTYRPPVFSTGGHDGPSRVAAEIDLTRFTEVLHVGHNRVFRKLA